MDFYLVARAPFRLRHGPAINHRPAIKTEDGKLPDMDTKAARFASNLASDA